MNISQHLFLSLFLVLSFRAVFYTPLLYIGIVDAVWIAVLLVVGILFFIKFLAGKRLITTTFDIYVMVMLAVPLYSAVIATLKYGQPIIYGILTQRGVWLVLAGVIVRRLVIARKLQPETIRNALLMLGWLSLIVYSVSASLMDPGAYTEVPGFVGFSEARGGYRFKFNPVFIVFCIIYYSISAFYARTSGKRSVHYGFVIVFLLYVFFIHSGRSLLVALGVALFAYYLVNASLVRMLKFTIVFSIVASLLVTLLYYVNAEKLSGMITSFADAFMVIAGKVSDDDSANARIVETALVYPYVQESWLFGNGDVSHQWNGGYEAMFGYFHPSDIGIIGTVFIYGVVGLLVFSGQFVFLLTKRIRMLKRSIFVDSCKVFMIYYFVQSLTNGASVHYVSIGIFFIAVLDSIARLKQESETIRFRPR